MVPTHWFNGIAVLAIALFALLFAAYGEREHRSLLADGTRSAEQIAEHTALITEGALDSTRQLLSAMAFLLHPPGLDKQLEPRAIRGGLLGLRAKSPHIMDLLVISADGLIEHWTGNGTPPDIRDRDYFLFHTKQSSRSLYISQPLLSKVHSGTWFFALSEALRDEHGNLRQILVAIVDVSLLSEHLGARLAIPDSSQALLSDDGTIYTRTPNHSLYVGGTVARPRALAALSDANPVTTIISTSQLDNKRRIIAFRKLSDYPMIAAGTIRVEELLAGWRLNMVFLVSLWLMLGAGIIWIARRSNAMSRAQYLLATFDSLTGVHNRGAILSTASKLERSQAHVGSLSLLMVDADNFKCINDRFGHLVGDKVLRQLSEVMQSQIRATDIVGRYGGEEFLVLLPDTGPQGALLLAEKVRDIVAEQMTKPVPVTVSIGVATTTEEEPSFDRALDRADKALYEAKDAGRNCVRVG